MVKGPSYRTIPLLLAFACVLCFDEQAMPKELPRCEIAKTKVEGQSVVWMAHAWGMPGQKGPILLAVEPSEEKANKQCMRYLKAVDKATKAAK